MQTGIKPNEVFVFGSNLAGRHGAGAARQALMEYGAILFQGEGLQGRSYAIPTKDIRIQTMTLGAIRHHVDEFKEFAKSRPDLQFYVTPIGCGLAGYKREQIKPMFDGMPSNCRFAETWAEEFA